MVHLLLLIQIVQPPAVQEQQLQLEPAENGTLALVAVFHGVAQLPLNVAAELVVQHTRT